MKKYFLSLGLLLLFNTLFAQNKNDCYIDDESDGVVNCRDKCPNTPKGAPVDTKGCMKDTDGDGVPNFYDKQLITPTECQPVNKDGIGMCPEPENRQQYEGIEDGIHQKFYLFFLQNSSNLEDYLKKELDKLTEVMKGNPNFPIFIRGFANSNHPKEKILLQKRLNAILQYMTITNGIDKDRFHIENKTSGNINEIDIDGITD